MADGGGRARDGVHVTLKRYDCWKRTEACFLPPEPLELSSEGGWESESELAWAWEVPPSPRPLGKFQVVRSREARARSIQVSRSMGELGPKVIVVRPACGMSWTCWTRQLMKGWFGPTGL